MPATKDKNIVSDIVEMFEVFKGHPEDKTIDVSTLYFFFNQQRLLVSEPEFCFFVYKRFNNQKQITLQEY